MIIFIHALPSLVFVAAQVEKCHDSKAESFLLYVIRDFIEKDNVNHNVDGLC